MGLYNARYKNEFMETVKSKEIYEWLFSKTFRFESKFGKDLFDFDKEQIFDYLKDRNMQFNSLKSHLSFITSYINWAKENRLQYITKDTTIEITEDELKSIAKKDDTVLHADFIYKLIGADDSEKVAQSLKNAQDKLLIYLIFLGVLGNRAYEIIELRFDHIEGNKIKLSKLHPDRTEYQRKDIKVDNFGLKLIENARRESIYQRYQSERRSDYNDHDYDLSNSRYIFRKSTVGNYNDDGKITYQALLRRLSSMSKYVGERLTMKRIQKSGMVNIGNKILNLKGELRKDDPTVIKSIFDRYDINGYQHRRKTLNEIQNQIEMVYNDQDGD